MNISRFALRFAPEGEQPAGGVPPAANPPPADAGKPPLDPAMISQQPAPVEPPKEGKPAETPKDGKPAETPKDGKPAETPKDDKPFEVAAYKDIKLPENVTADDPMLGTTLGAFAKHRIDPKVAEALISDLAPELRKDARAPYEAFNEQNKAWQEEIRRDPEIGGSNFDQTIGRINALLGKYGDPGLFDEVKKGSDGKPVLQDGKPIIVKRGALSLTGAGNHPAVIRTMHRFALALGEGKGIEPAKGASDRSPEAVAAAMYPSARKPGA